MEMKGETVHLLQILPADSIGFRGGYLFSHHILFKKQYVEYDLEHQRIGIAPAVQKCGSVALAGIPAPDSGTAIVGTSSVPSSSVKEKGH